MAHFPNNCFVLTCLPFSFLLLPLCLLIKKVRQNGSEYENEYSLHSLFQNQSVAPLSIISKQEHISRFLLITAGKMTEENDDSSVGVLHSLFILYIYKCMCWFEHILNLCNRYICWRWLAFVTMQSFSKLWWTKWTYDTADTWCRFRI